MLALMMALATGCSSKDSESVEDGGPAGTDDSGETMGDDTASPEDEAPLLNGLYSSGFLVGPVSGLVVGLQLEFAMSEDEDGNRRYSRCGTNFS